VTDQERIQQMLRKPINRRGFLSLMGASASAAALAACTSPGGSTAPSAAPGTTGPTPSGPAGSAPAASFEIETELLTYNWSDYVAPENIEEFKKRFGVENFGYDTFASNEELLAKLQGGATGYDIACPTAEYVTGMAEEGFVQELDLSRIPNMQYINATFKNTAWDPENKYIVPKDYGTTGIMYRKKLVPEPVTSWKEFYELTKGKYSGKTVFVDSMGDVFPFPLKMLGYSLNDNDPAHIKEAGDILLELAPHVHSLDSDTYQVKLANEEAVLCLGWTGPIVDLRADPATADTSYIVPSEGTLYWLDTWVLLTDAPHPNAAYAWLNFIHEPEIQKIETESNGYATPNDEAKKLVSQELLDDQAIFPPDDVIKNLEGSLDHSGNQQRADIWAEFKSKIGG
jgi:spermidine/putrescine transport system substrate-binding protein